MPPRRAGWWIAAGAVVAFVAGGIGIALLNRGTDAARPAPNSPTATILVRESGATPQTVAATPTPVPGYVAIDQSELTVIQSVEADALFAQRDECEQPGGYTVEFPEDWWTNTAIGSAPACTWFSPTFFEVNDASQRPEEAAISLYIHRGQVGTIYSSTFEEFVRLDGLGGRRREHDYTSKGAGDPRVGQLHYEYSVWFGGGGFFAATDSSYPGDYRLNKAVLDRMMATIDFDR